MMDPMMAERLAYCSEYYLDQYWDLMMDLQMVLYLDSMKVNYLASLMAMKMVHS